jgi:6-phosphogluconolactonase
VQVTVARDAAAAAAVAAETLAAAIAAAVAARGSCSIALSGGQTPWQMLEKLLGRAVPWSELHVFQVDERAVPFDDERRNAKRMRALLCREGALSLAQFHVMPVEELALETAASDYGRTLAQHAGDPPVLDVVQLGLGPDGHTASLVPGDPLLGRTDSDVGISIPYQGARRMSLTFPALSRSRQVLWLVTGESKAGMLARLVTGDATIPAGRVARARARVVADAAAASLLPAGIGGIESPAG